MKKLLMSTAMAAMFGAMIPAASALTAAGNFDVVINLTSKCEINSTNAATGAVISNVTFAYTSFQTAASTSSTSNFNVRCTNSLPYSMALDSAAVTDDATNLAYTLALSALTSPGTGANQAYTVIGTMAANQAGTCPTPACTNAAATNKTRTLTVTY